MLAEIDLNKSLQELENSDWGESVFDSHLVVTCHKLHRKPLNQFNIEDLRIMISQNISLEFLMPLALKHLHSRPLAHGAYYEGDLLVAVLNVDNSFWYKNPNYRKEVHLIVEKVLFMGQRKKKRFRFSIDYVKDAYRLFRQ